MGWIRPPLIAAVFVAWIAAGCTPIPRVELAAYTTAYSDVQTVTNSVLDIVKPYERIMIRYTSRSATERMPVAAGAEPIPASPPRPFPQPSPPATPPTAPIDPGAIDFSLFDDPAAARAAAAARANRPVIAIQPRQPRQTTAGGRTVTTITGSRTVTRTVAFTYETRAAYSDIGDPPLVGAFRNLSNVILRFNNLLVAYADGVSGRLLGQDLAALSSAAGALGELASVAGIPGAGVSGVGLAGIASKLQPLANIAGAAVDRAQLRQFLLDNAQNVDDAIELMARNAPQLDHVVEVGTFNYEVFVPGSSSRALNARQLDIRRVIADWMGVLIDVQGLLRELKTAVAIPNGLETRLRNLDSSMKTRIDTSALKKRIATLGTPALAP